MTGKVTKNYLQVSPATDRPARRSASRPLCCTQMPIISVIKCDRWRSPVYHTDRLPKLTAPETISRSRDLVSAHKNSHGSRDLTTPLSGIVCHPWDSTYYLPPTYQIWSLYLHSLWRYERRYSMSKIEWFRDRYGHSKSVEIAPFDRAHMSSY